MSAKKLKIEYGDSVFSLPRENVMLTLPSASEFDLKVLLIAAADDSLRTDYDRACERLCKQLDCTKSALGRALDFWRCAGVMSVCDVSADGTAAVSPAPENKTLQSNSLPTYTESQTADVMEAHTELAQIIDACQQIVGKIFTPAESASIVGIYDYLGLNDPGYIETLYSYCKAGGKTSPRYIEKVAIGMHDEGITTTEALSEYIEQRERIDELQSQIRTLIGAGSRSLTAKEKKAIECWGTEWKLDISVITRAYEVTIDSIGEYKIAYMSRVLENWHAEGLTTLEAVEAALMARQKSKADAEKSASGFETDEYFEAALARSQKYLENNKSDS
ncbi:MAG: DnaD domain protein [Clostridia bacterium]|nr:DnaD domain protein [Clostridia bacterium]